MSMDDNDKIAEVITLLRRVEAMVNKIEAMLAEIIARAPGSYEDSE